MKKILSFRDYILAAVLYVAINVFVFHGGLYRYFCKPDSYSGNVYARMDVLEEIEKQKKGGIVALIGDSITEEGIDAGHLSRLINKPVVNLALPGGSPLDWFFFLRAIDPAQDRFDTIVLTVVPHPVPSTPDQEGIQSLLPVANIPLMIEYLSLQREASRSLQEYYAAFDRIYAFRRDIRDLILNPSRWQDIVRTRQAHLETIRNYQGQNYDVCSVVVQKKTGRVIAWGDLRDEEIQRLTRHNVKRISKLNEDPAVSGIREPLKWIAKLYEKSNTRLIVVSIPFGPGHRITAAATPIKNYLREVAALNEESRVQHWTAFEEKLFMDCSNFFDYRHLNQKGRRLFSQWLSEQWHSDGTSAAAGGR